ncbi:MAG: peptidoglycan DD-metalloendopeptidase family protein [Halofilum sp. (in: g-proteobacteria)]|nr:peptidoglycan DD-metalloendopeptidase family protein [Halofilum sp. (in: g-proteobacteria)]
MRRWLAIGLVCLLVAGCVGSLAGNRFRPEVYTVRSGDTLYSIAWRYRIDHQDLMRWNDIDNARSLRVGQRLRLHPDAAGSPSTASTATASADRNAESSGGDRADTGARVDSRSGSGGGGDKASAAKPETGGDEATGEPPGRWRWPTRGTVVARFGDGRAGGRGVDIRGEQGQPIHATAAGDVVYSGDGLKAYGRLLIVRHEGDFLSAYAHNSELLVAEGDRVDAGQPIARMGRTREGTALLHFEIRRGGSPVDPLDYLPSRD